MLDSIKRIFEKYIGQLLIIITISGIILYGYSYWRDLNEDRKYADLIGTKEKFEQLTKYTAKLESDYRSQKDLVEKVKKEFVEYKKTANERIKLLSDATYLIGTHVQKQDGPDYYFQTPKETQNYVLNELRIAGDDSPPIGYILIKSDGRIYKKNYKSEIVVKTLQTHDEENGKINVYSKAFWVSREGGLAEKRREDLKNWKDVQYELPIVGGTAVVDPTQKLESKRFYWWSPHINGGFAIGGNSSGAFIRPSMDFSFMGYGRNRFDLDWKFGHLGFDSDTKFKEPGVHFMPFSYRFWPSVLTNTYAGPAVGITSNGWNGQLNLNLSF